MTTPGPNPEGGEAGALRYQRCRFSAPILCDRRYTRDHYWLREKSPGMWRTGLSPWAVRLLGDLVEYRSEVAEGAEVRLEQAIGSLEGFKAAVEIRAVAAGTFVRANPILAVNLDVISLDCYGEGWLYEIRGASEADTCDAKGYRLLLDGAVDAMRGSHPIDPA